MITPSILDRLIDLVPEKNTEQAKSPRQVSYDTYNNIKRDLENLLNSRRRCISWDPAWHELKTSLFDYGILDFTNLQLDLENIQNNFCHHLEQVIMQYEPRFKAVKVTLPNNSDSHDRILHLRIEGLLHTASSFEPVVFESMLETYTRSFRIND
jgi:type VI secretion system protein ImpF